MTRQETFQIGVTTCRIFLNLLPSFQLSSLQKSEKEPKMSVIVRNMQMPTGCGSCDFANYFSDGEPYCRRLMRHVTATKRLDDCPLSPLTPLEKALEEKGPVNYCDECGQFQIVGSAAYCKVDGKLIHPIMMMRGQGTGPAWNCKKGSIKKDE